MRETLLSLSALRPAFSSAVAAYDEGTSRHCVRVGEASVAMGQALGLPDSDLEAISWAGMLHDLGKLAVAQTILHKPGPLDEAEWAEIKRHPIIGSDLLLTISPKLAPIAAGVRAHHERWDGSGYPDGLAGQNIPLFGRIICVPDCFDAMTAFRTYRGGNLSVAQALEELYACAGTQFDPDLVALFTEIHLGAPAR